MMLILIEDYMRDSTSRDISNYHPIFCGKIETPRYGSERIYRADFELMKKAASIILQIDALRIQLRYYEEIKSDPLKAMETFQKTSNLWGIIMRIPYFLRKDSDTFDHREKFNLLMIKPGVEEVDLSSIKYFSADGGRRYGRRQTERIKIYRTEMRDDSCDRLMICLPKSISVESLYELI